jgi:hypothetical protein
VPAQFKTGDAIWYVLPEGANFGNGGKKRPGIIVNDWNSAEYANIVVFVGGINDLKEAGDGTYWGTSVRFDPNGAPDTFHPR